VLRSEAEARLGEGRIPIRLQHLHHRLLDEAIASTSKLSIMLGTPKERPPRGAAFDACR